MTPLEKTLKRILMIKMITLGLLLSSLLIASPADDLDKEASNLFFGEGKQKEAYPMFLKACDMGSGSACGFAGSLNFYGKVRKQDFTLSLKLQTRGCDLNDGTSCNMLSRHYENGLAVKKDINKAIQLRQQSCDLNDSGGCEDLAADYYKGTYIKKDIDYALELLDKSCELSNASKACSILGKIYQDGADRIKDDKLAAYYLERSCSTPLIYDWVPKSCQDLALLYDEGTDQDHNEAFKAFNRACGLGMAYSCFAVGNAYGDGHGIDKDQFKAVEYYKKACDSDIGGACTNIGVAYNKGNGVKQNHFTAFNLNKKACDLKSEVGCYN
jgi:hypothetical protein